MLVTYDDLHDLAFLRLAAGLDDARAAAVFSVSIRTWHRWKKSPPPHVLELLRWRAGFIPGWWQMGMQLRGLEIVSAHQAPVHRNHIEGFWWRFRLQLTHACDGCREEYYRWANTPRPAPRRVA